MNRFFRHVDIVFTKDRQWGIVRKSATVTNCYTSKKHRKPNDAMCIDLHLHSPVPKISSNLSLISPYLTLYIAVVFGVYDNKGGWCQARPAWAFRQIAPRQPCPNARGHEPPGPRVPVASSKEQLWLTQPRSRFHSIILYLKFKISTFHHVQITTNQDSRILKVIQGACWNDTTTRLSSFWYCMILLASLQTRVKHPACSSCWR